VWSWPAVAVISVLLYGIGVNAMYGDQYVLSARLYLVALAILIIKVIASEEARRQEKGTWLGISILVLSVGAACMYVSLRWIESRKAQMATKAQDGADYPKSLPSSSPKTDARRATEIPRPLKYGPRKQTLAPVNPQPVGVHIEQRSEGPNSPNIIGNQNTVNITSAPRSLNDEQIEALRVEIAPFKGQPIHLLTSIFDSESQRYAGHFEKAFRAAEWNVVESQYQDKLPRGTEVGLWLGVKDRNNQPPAALALGNFLVSKLHLHVRGQEFTDAQEGHVYLIVGMRP
jgi:hypothetical protein